MATTTKGTRIMVRREAIIETPVIVPARRLAIGRGSAARHPWWLWPHLLGLDAPVVALAWQDWWSRSAREPLLPGERLVLGLGVWLIYLADRLADVWRADLRDADTARHVFAAAWRWPMFALAACVAGSLVMLSPIVLPAREFFAGLGLLAAAGMYFGLIHHGHPPRWTCWLPKEAVVGGMFALGTVFFALCRLAPARGTLLAGAAALFGVVCFLNCALITSWERNVRDRQDPASLLNAFPGMVNGGLRTVCWLTAMLAAAGVLTWSSVCLLPVALSAVALACLDRWRRRFSADGVRCLVDVVLLTPWVCHGFASVYL